MALQKTIEFNNGVVLDNAYIKITSILFSYILPYSVKIRVSIFKNLSAYSENKPEVEKLEYFCTDPEYTTYFASDKFVNKDPQILAYDYLKVLPFYNGAIDV